MFPGPVQEEDPWPRMAQPALRGEAVEQLRQRELTCPVVGCRHGRGHRLGAVAVPPIVFVARARHHHPAPAMFVEAAQQLQARLYPPEILNRCCKLAGDDVPRQVQEMRGPHRLHEARRLAGIHEVHLVPRYAFPALVPGHGETTRVRRAGGYRVHLVAPFDQEGQARESDEPRRARDQHSIHETASTRRKV